MASVAKLGRRLEFTIPSKQNGRIAPENQARLEGRYSPPCRVPTDLQISSGVVVERDDGPGAKTTRRVHGWVGLKPVLHTSPASCGKLQLAHIRTICQDLPSIQIHP